MKQKIDNIFSWFNRLSTFVKVISAIFVIGTWGVAAITAYNNLVIKKYESGVQININLVSKKLDDIAEKAISTDNAIKTINENQVVISGQVSNVSEQVNVLGRKFETQTKAIGNHFQKENMLQDKINFLQELIDDEKKNNGLSGLLIQSSNLTSQ
jgi:transcription initiation factor IIF auxiliary subunit